MITPTGPSDELVILFRPTGAKELALVGASGFRRWPARLLGQPIFYPVTTREYAIRIARDWNVTESGYGCVTRFQVRKSFMDHYPVQTVGGSSHQEWWIPAEELELMNDQIVGLIEVIDEFGARPVVEIR